MSLLLQQLISVGPGTASWIFSFLFSVVPFPSFLKVQILNAALLHWQMHRIRFSSDPNSTPSFQLHPPSQFCYFPNTIILPSSITGPFSFIKQLERVSSPWWLLAGSKVKCLGSFTGLWRCCLVFNYEGGRPGSHLWNVSRERRTRKVGGQHSTALCWVLQGHLGDRRPFVLEPLPSNPDNKLPCRLLAG